MTQLEKLAVKLLISWALNKQTEISEIFYFFIRREIKVKTKVRRQKDYEEPKLPSFSPITNLMGVNVNLQELTNLL